MVRRVPTTDVLIKRVIFVGRAVDSHSTGTEIDTSHLHRIDFFFVCGACALQARGDLRRLERFWSSTIHNSETLTHEITFEIPPKKRHFFFFDEKQNKTNR